MGQSLTDLITQTTLLLEKYDSASFLLTKKSDDYSEQLRLQTENGLKLLKAEIADLDVEATIQKLRDESKTLQDDMRKTAESFDINTLTKELEEKLETLSSSLEEKLKTIDVDGILETIKKDTDDAIAKIKASTYSVKMVNFQHTLPSKLESNTKYDFSILGGNPDATYKLDTKSIFAVSKVTNIDAGDVVSITTPTVENATTTYEIAIIEVLDGVETPKILNLEVGHINKVGQMLFDKVGTHTFIVPAGVKNISAVAVGAGGGGGYNWATQGGCGGALAYANNIAVTAGQQITIVVGAGGKQQTDGGDSKVGNFFYAEGGKFNSTVRAKPINGTVACQGGQGGISSDHCGGAGAGGYSGNGGDAKYNNHSGVTPAGGGGGAGHGYDSSTFGFAGGGGVGLYGQGNSGKTENQNNGNSFYSDDRYTGKGGSGGEDGHQQHNSTLHGCGGKFGGGGAGGGTSVSNNNTFCNGGDGGVRIIWGENRSFPFNAKDISEDK